MGIEDRMTDRARKVLALSNQEAQKWNHEYIGTEHILMGIIKEGSGVGFSVLTSMDVPMDKVSNSLLSTFRSGPDMVTMGKLSQTPRAKKVIEYAIAFARKMNHNYLGTEHIVYGLLQEGDGLGGAVLNAEGVTVGKYEIEVVKILGKGMGPVEESEDEKVIDMVGCGLCACEEICMLTRHIDAFNFEDITDKPKEMFEDLLKVMQQYCKHYVEKKLRT